MEYVISLDRRQRKRQAVHHQLLENAARLFRERGVSRTTVEDIAESADVSRQTVFNHFPYKEALALELAADGVEEVALRAYALLESGHTALDAARFTAEAVLDRAIRDGEVAVVAAGELLHSDPDRSRRASELVPLRHIFEAIFVQGREEGTIRDDLPPEAIASRMTAGLRCIIAQVLASDPHDLRQELSIYFDMMFNGIRDRRRDDAFVDKRAANGTSLAERDAAMPAM